MANEKLKTASVLAFERKLDPSDALFYAGKWSDVANSDKWVALSVREKAIRGTISNRFKSKGGDSDAAKLDAKIEDANLQKVDVVTLPMDCDTLKVRFTLRILGNVGEPNVCNDAEYKARLDNAVKAYIANHGFKELAKRYAYNIANARFLWRNRIGAEEIEVHVTQYKDKNHTPLGTFKALDFSLRDFEQNQDQINQLATAIEAGLSNEGYTLLNIIAFARIGEGQEVFPSQELVLDQGGSKKGRKSRMLYKVNEIAAIHSQKIGNALRTIDTWYPETDVDVGPISVEPYGAVTSRGKAYRQPAEKADFYTLFDKWTNYGQIPQSEGNQHYVIANLIRGGVFGESGKE